MFDWKNNHADALFKIPSCKGSSLFELTSKKDEFIKRLYSRTGVRIIRYITSNL